MAFEPPGWIGRARLRRMITGGAVKEMSGRFYLDEAGYLDWRAARRKRGLIMAGIMVALIVLLMVAGGIRVR